MSNRAFLIGSNHDRPAGPTPNGMNYNPDTEILAASSNSIPIFWWSLFSQEDLKHNKINEASIPALIVETPVGQARLKQRIAAITNAFPAYLHQISDWVGLVKDLPFCYLKMDVTEVWLLDPDNFEKQLIASLRWCESGTDDDIQTLTGLCDATYDSGSKRLAIPTDYDLNCCLYGYRWVREVPWKEE